MEKAEMRVLIAKDVLKMLAARKLKARTGQYIRTEDPAWENQLDIAIDGGADKSKQLKAPKKCDVCAIGSCFVAAIDRFDKLSLKQLGDLYNYFHSDEREVYVKYLKRWFSNDQLDIMEAAFEGIDMWVEDKDNSKINVVLAAFYKKYNSSATKRLTAIMENIIKNKGTFKPQVI